MRRPWDERCWTTRMRKGTPRRTSRNLSDALQPGHHYLSNFPTASLMVLPSARPADLAWTALITWPLCFLSAEPISWIVTRTRCFSSSADTADGRKDFGPVIYRLSL